MWHLFHDIESSNQGTTQTTSRVFRRIQKNGTSAAKKMLETRQRLPNLKKSNESNPFKPYQTFHFSETSRQFLWCLKGLCPSVLGFHFCSSQPLLPWQQCIRFSRLWDKLEHTVETTTAMATNRMMMPMSCPQRIFVAFHPTRTLHFNFHNFTDSQQKYFMAQLPTTRISTKWNQIQTALAKTLSWRFPLELKLLADPHSALSSWGHANHLENGLRAYAFNLPVRWLLRRLSDGSKKPKKLLEFIPPSYVICSRGNKSKLSLIPKLLISAYGNKTALHSCVAKIMLEDTLLWYTLELPLSGRACWHVCKSNFL